MSSAPAGGTGRRGGWSRRAVLGCVPGTAALVGGARPARAQTPRPHVLWVVIDSLPAVVLAPHHRDAAGRWAAAMPRLTQLAAESFVFSTTQAAHPDVPTALSALLSGRPGSETGAVLGGLPVDPELPLVVDAIAETADVFVAGLTGLPRRPFGPRVDTVLGDLDSAEVGNPAVVRALRGQLAGRPPGRPWLGVVGLRGLSVLDRMVGRWAGLDRVPDLGLAERELPDPPDLTVPEPEPRLVQSVLRSAAAPEGWPAGGARLHQWYLERALAQLDRWVGAVVDTLDASVHGAQTTLVLTAACGHPLGAQGRVVPGAPYAGSLEVPLLVRGGGPGRSAALVSGLDLAPTICDLMGAPQLPRARGFSLRPLLDGRAGSWRREVVSEVLVEGRVVRTAEFSYTHFRDDPIDQLFHMGNDPLQARDLARDTGYAATVVDHRARLDAREAGLRPCALSKAGWQAARDQLGG